MFIRERSLMIALAGGCMLLGGGMTIAASEVDRFAPLDTTVTIEDVRSTAGAVDGVLVNRTGDELEHVHLIVSDRFLWRNERHPGPESPGDAYTLVVAGPIPPHGTAPFRFERPAPLPERRDGEFTTDVAAVELTRRPADRSSETNESLSRVIQRDDH